MLIQISAGQGPEECQLAVGMLYDALKNKYGDMEKIVERKGKHRNCYQSITFETQHDLSDLEGTVLWICKSPYRLYHKRKNWYIDVSVIPEKENISKEEDYLVETFHCGGNGGQNVNKVESGVRITHIPTGMVVTAREERSQYMNKKKAFQRMQVLLQEKETWAGENQRRQAWCEHNRLVRGNPTRTYIGMEFKEKRNL